jgi:DNA-binding response OmpR family regulator
MMNGTSTASHEGVSVDPATPVSIVIYSDDSTVRQSLLSALGTTLGHGLGVNHIKEFATAKALRSYVDEGHAIDLFILDGEATPEGGMSVARQLKDEVFNCPPVMVLIGRIQDNWLATWSRADAILVHPIDPFVLADKVVGVLTHTA